MSAYSLFKVHTAHQSASDPNDDQRAFTKRDIIHIQHVLAEGRRSVAAVPVSAEPSKYVWCQKDTPKHSRADWCTNTLRVE